MLDFPPWLEDWKAEPRFEVEERIGIIQEHKNVTAGSVEDERDRLRAMELVKAAHSRRVRDVWCDKAGR